MFGSQVQRGHNRGSPLGIPPEPGVRLGGVQKPHHNDVLCGRGVTTNRHKGNEKFRSLVNCNKELYVSSSKRQKMGISRSIVDAVRSLDPVGRFLEKDPPTGLWFDIGDKKAIEKTSQALRDGAACLRKQLSRDLGDPDFLKAVFDSDNTKGGSNNSKTPTGKRASKKSPKGKAPAKAKGHRRVKSNPVGTKAKVAAKKASRVPNVEPMSPNSSNPEPIDLPDIHFPPETPSGTMSPGPKSPSSEHSAPAYLMSSSFHVGPQGNPSPASSAGTFSPASRPPYNHARPPYPPPDNRHLHRSASMEYSGQGQQQQRGNPPPPRSASFGDYGHSRPPLSPKNSFASPEAPSPRPFASPTCSSGPHQPPPSGPSPHGPSPHVPNPRAYPGGPVVGHPGMSPYHAYHQQRRSPGAVGWTPRRLPRHHRMGTSPNSVGGTPFRSPGDGYPHHQSPDYPGSQRGHYSRHPQYIPGLAIPSLACGRGPGNLPVHPQWRRREPPPQQPPEEGRQPQQPQQHHRQHPQRRLQPPPMLQRGAAFQGRIPAEFSPPASQMMNSPRSRPIPRNAYPEHYINDDRCEEEEDPIPIHGQDSQAPEDIKSAQMENQGASRTAEAPSDMESVDAMPQATHSPPREKAGEPMDTCSPNGVNDVGLSEHEDLLNDDDLLRSLIVESMPSRDESEQHPYDETNPAADDIPVSPLPYDGMEHEGHEGNPDTLMELPENIMCLPISPCGPHDSHDGHY